MRRVRMRSSGDRMKPVITWEAIGIRIGGGPKGDVAAFRLGSTGERMDSSIVCTTGSIPWEINSSMAEVRRPACVLSSME